MAVLFEKTKLLTDKQFHYCPGCNHGIIHRLVAEVIDEMNLDGKVIGVDVDQSAESETVITSAMKLLSNSVYDGVKDFYDGSFPGGKTSIFSAKNDGIGLPMETSKFEKFNQEQYDAIYKKLADGEITLIQFSEDNNDPTKDLTELANTKVTFVE